MTGQTSQQRPPTLAVAGLSKRYGKIQALDDVSLDVLPGQVHALVGENGAGKSTLVKIISGGVQPDDGSISLEGARVDFGAPADASLAGIHLVHQEFALLPDRTVLQNVWLGRELRGRAGMLDWRRMRRRTREVFEWLDLEVDLDRRVRTLSTAAQQFVEIARALVSEARVLMLDEPTAALPPSDAERLFEVLSQLRDRGIAIIYISHRLIELEQLADVVTVLKDGRKVATRPMREVDLDEIVRLMVGRAVVDLYPPRGTRTTEEPVLQVEGLTDPPAVLHADLAAYPGQILGIYGLEGHGQDQLLACLAGDRKPVRGTLRLQGRPRPWGGVRTSIRQGLGYVPQDRKAQGLILDFSGVQNISLPRLDELTRGGWINERREYALADEAAASANIQGDIRAPVKALSGGNQQKLLLARLVAAEAQVLLLNQPSRGVDVGSKSEIYDLIRSLCERGNAAIVVSPEIPELLGLCDRILVMSRGELVGEVGPDATEEDVLALAVTR